MGELSFWEKLKRRHVVKVGVAYVVVAAGVGGAADAFLPGLGAPDWMLPSVLGLLVLGLPVALVLAWAYELTPEGIVRDAPEPTVGEPPAEAVAASAVSIEEERKSIVVLPFDNMSPDPNDAYFSDGLTEEIINALANVSGLRVIARTSAFAFKGSNQDVREIGRQLGVGTVLEGSVRKAGDRLRITAQLIDASDGHHLWSERYDRDLEDVFAIQDEIAQMIAGRLQSDEKAAARERPTDNLEAYEAYLRGRFYFAKGASGDYAKSVDLYERAIELDPGFAEAYAGLAEAWNEWAHVEEPTDRFPWAKANALKALELDPTLADAHATLGNVHFLFDWDWNGAIESFERAIELNQNSAKAHQHYVTLLGNLGRVDEAIEHGLQSVALDPLSPHANHAAAFAHFQARRFEESLEYDERALELAPDYHIAKCTKGMALMEAGRLDEAEDQFQHMLEAWPDAPFTRACLAQVHDRTGRRELAIEQVRAIEDHPGPNRGHVAHDAAWTHAALGNVEEALDWIDRALEARDPFMVGLACFYTWDPLRADPRFQAVLRKMDFPEWSYREGPV